MNLSSALIKQVLELEDFDTWARVRRHYLSTEYHQLYDAIDKHVTKYHKLPKLSELKLSVRDSATLDKVYALDAIDTDAEPFLLLDYLKNEFAQKETLFQIDKWIDKSLAFETAEEVIRGLQAIAYDVENKVEIQPDSESMQKISLFDSEDELARRITLGLNAEFDATYNFLATDYILMGGKRGSGKSITCNNIARSVVNSGKSARYYSIEMPSRQVLQRDVAIATTIPFSKIRDKNLSVTEWEKIAKFWADRYENGQEHFEVYKTHHSFDRFHAAVSKELLKQPKLEIIYDPHLTIAKMRSDLNKAIALGEDIGVIVVDYLNQIETPGKVSGGMYDWITQIEVSKGLKQLAQDYNIPVFSPYQTDANGEARFAKGILDAADAAMVLTAHDEAIEFKVTKMRNADDEVTFVSEMDWSSLQIGPGNGKLPEPEEQDPKKGKKHFKGGNKVNPDIYDDDKEDPPW